MHWMLQRLCEFGERPALVYSGTVYTCSRLAELAGECQQDAYRHQMKRGGVVGLVGDYSPAAIAWFLALAELKCVIVPLAGNPAEHPERLHQAGAQFVVRAQNDQWTTEAWAASPGDTPPLLAQLSERDRAGLILFSSGSSGRPKGMVHDLDVWLDTFQERRAKSLSLIVLLLFDHIGGLNTLFHALATGAQLVVPEDRSPATVAALIAKHHVAVLPASPTFLNLLVASGEHERQDLSSLRVITYGTEPMPESLLQRLHRSFPRARLIQTFGTSETGIAHSSSPSSGSVWMRIEDPNLEWKIVEGELWLRSRTQILGYLNHSSDSFTPEGWFRTGDLAESQTNGTLRILGRRGELINVGGEKVLPAEVESIILTVPGVADCLVQGEANAITGQHVAAEVVALPGADLAALKREIRRACRNRLSASKVPARVSFTHALPGKRLKKIRKTGPP